MSTSTRRTSDGSTGTAWAKERSTRSSTFVHRRHPGRPSVSGEQERTLAMTVRVPRSARVALEEIESAQGRRLADVSREALDEYIRRHAS